MESAAGWKWKKTFTSTKIKDDWKSVETVIQPITEKRWYRFKDICKNKDILECLEKKDKINYKEFKISSFKDKITNKNKETFVSYKVYDKLIKLDN